MRRPSPGACFGAIRHPELYRNFAIHVFVMLPAALVMAWIGTRVDAALGLGRFLSWPASGLLGLLLVAVGGVWVWYVYGYLFLSGGGSPGTHVDGGPTWLVDTGPYTVIRHPSVLGKLAGVAGLGVAFGSPSFLLGFVPILVVYSLVTNRWLQERHCDARFGEAYQVYRERVPMLLPRPSGIRRWMRDEAAVGDDTVRAHGASPPAVWYELRWYLVGLALLLVLFSAALWVIRGIAA
ncbi:MAG: isoprenylcysteine carboxylmethyltransferase family protein [Deltaproteobacteria bacterium]|nr:isoprenylcysteine carboxylmethyltransferase family protein [Deltaproteobacteria bacterium]